MSAATDSIPEVSSNSKSNSIQPGAFIRHGYANYVCGIVLRRGSVCKGRIPGYVVRLANGKQEFIPADDAVLIAA